MDRANLGGVGVVVVAAQVGNNRGGAAAGVAGVVLAQRLGVRGGGASRLRALVEIAAGGPLAGHISVAVSGPFAAVTDSVINVTL